MITLRCGLVLGALLVAIGLPGCSDARKVLGYDKSVPDEFRVVGRALLTMPKTFDLPSPAPGEEGLVQELSAPALAYQALTSGKWDSAWLKKPKMARKD